MTIADGLPWEESTPANIKGQMDKIDADASEEDSEESADNDSDDDSESDEE